MFRSCILGGGEGGEATTTLAESLHGRGGGGRAIHHKLLYAYTVKDIAAAMYQGHHMLDNIRCRQQKDGSKDLVSNSFALSVSNPFKRSRTIGSSSASKAFNLGLHGALQNLEAVVANMVEFVVLLGGCERISPRPYDTYLHVENFMFGQHVEKQQITSFLLQHNAPGPPAVLPIFGSRGVGKKTLVAHVQL